MLVMPVDLNCYHLVSAVMDPVGRSEYMLDLKVPLNRCDHAHALSGQPTARNPSADTHNRLAVAWGDSLVAS